MIAQLARLKTFRIFQWKKLSTWYENSACIKIPIEEFDKKTISFTYGDSHPTFSDRVHDGRFGPERYIEAHIWSDEVIRRYCEIESMKRE